MNNKFKINETVLYKNGDTFELGIIKEIIEDEIDDKAKDALYKEKCSQCSYAKLCHDDCTYCEEFLEAATVYKYRVWYHTGDTTAVTDEAHLHKISNAYAFNIIRKSANREIELSPARQMASRILGQLELYGDMYYKLEDWLTDFLEGNEHDMPRGIESEYLKCALRVEVRDYFDANNAIDISSEDIEIVIDELFESFSQSVLNTEFISDTVKAYIDINDIKCESEDE